MEYKVSKYNIVKEDNDKIIVYNSYTKASLFLEKGSDTKAFEDIKEFNKLDEDTKKVLIDNGFIIDKNRDELLEIKYMYEKRYYNESTLNIVLVPSLSCNFACPYCFEKDLKCGKENVKDYFETLKKFGTKSFANYRSVHLSLFGGEPLLCAKEFIEFLDWVKKDSAKKGYEYFTTAVTNGSLLTKEILKSLLDHNLKLMQITIDSDKETHDKTRRFRNGAPSFDVLIEKIKMIVTITKNNKDFKFLLRINLNNTTIERVQASLNEIPKKYRSKVNLLIRSIYNTHAYNEKNENNNSQIDKYFEMGKAMGFKIFQESFVYQSCEACAGNKFFYLLPDLTAWKCINDLKFYDACIGKITPDGILEYNITNNVKWAKEAMSTFADEECLNCKKLPDCYGGCILHKCKQCKKQCRPFEMTSIFHTFI